MYRLLERVVRRFYPLRVQVRRVWRGVASLQAVTVQVVRLALPTALCGLVVGDAVHCISLWAMELMGITAEEEYRKNPDLRKEDIRLLREWLVTEKHLPDVTEVQLIIFHHSCYYDLERTKECIENYYTMRTHMPEFFTNRDVTSPELTSSIAPLYAAAFPVRDPRNGHQFMYHGLRSSDTSNYVFVDTIKIGLMMFDAYALEHGTAPGIEVIFDMEGTTIGHLLKVSLTALRKYSHYLQEASPIRLKAIHMVNANYLVDKTIFLAKPFLKKELYEAIHIHMPGSETLYEHIPRECLPAELGGTLESKEVYCGALVKKLERLKDFFKAEELLRVNETLREKKKKQKPAAVPDQEALAEQLIQ